jgi:glyoxylase-like metal-dependent hydrolase (beta-lactamase superfamily II)
MELFYLKEHFSHKPHWVTHGGTRENWLGMGAIPILKNLKPKIYLIPLKGHTRGHAGVAIQTVSGWTLHCGDAINRYFKSADPTRQDWKPPGFFVRRMVGKNGSRLRELILKYGKDVDVISSHDAYSFRRHGGKQLIRGS